MALTTLANVKEWLSIAVSDTTMDALLTRLITAESDRIEKWCGRVFSSASATEVYNGTGTGRLPLSRGPVTAVASVSVNGVSIPASTGPTVAGFAFDSNGLYLIGYAPAVTGGLGWPAAISTFPLGWQNVSVTYTAGFASVPTDVAQACIELVSMRFQERKRIGKTSENLAGQTTSYDVSAFPPSVKEALRNYRRVTP